MVVEDALRAMVREVVREETKKLAAEGARAPRAATTGQLPDLVRRTTAAAELDISEATVRGWQNKGKIKKYKKGGIVFVDRAELRRYVSEPEPDPDSDVSVDEWAAKKLSEQ